jgi:hypothetical protein
MHHQCGYCVLLVQSQHRSPAERQESLKKLKSNPVRPSRFIVVSHCCCCPLLFGSSVITTIFIIGSGLKIELSVILAIGDCIAVFIIENKVFSLIIVLV